MKTIIVAGATGYLGRHLCAAFSAKGFYVTAIVRDTQRAADVTADVLIEAEATRPETLQGIMAGTDMVVSALGITRQRDGLGYWDVDYQANLNLLEEAERAGVTRFGFVHVLNADKLSEVPLVAAKAAFVEKLQASSIEHAVIAPSGFFSDMGDFLSMARNGRVWLFGAGHHRINPIHGADLAMATVEAMTTGTDWLDVGGPEAFSHTQIASLAFQALNRPKKVTHLPDALRRFVLRVLPWVTPRSIHGPAQFFLSAMGMEMVGTPKGSRRLADHFKAEAAALARSSGQ